VPLDRYTPAGPAAAGRGFQVRRMCYLCFNVRCEMGWEIEAPKSGGGSKEKPPAGTHLAVCVAVIDMGKQYQEPFKPTDRAYWAPRAYFVWELCDEKITGTEKNHVIAIDLTLSIGEKAKLYKWVLARTGKPPAAPFNPTTELGQACMLNVVEQVKGEKKYPKIEGVTGLPKMFAANPPKPTYPLTCISLEEFRGGKPLPEWVPWLYGSPLEDHIKACQEIGGPKPMPKKGDAAPVGAAGESTSLGGPVPF
jgi:hypothetical protein